MAGSYPAYSVPLPVAAATSPAVTVVPSDFFVPSSGLSDVSLVREAVTNIFPPVISAPVISFDTTVFRSSPSEILIS